MPNSIIYLSDTSNYILGDIINIDYLNYNLSKFIISNNYTKDELITKSVYIITEWSISDFYYDLSNSKIMFNSPLLLNFNGKINYTYKINNITLNNTQIYINSNSMLYCLFYKYNLFYH